MARLRETKSKDIMDILRISFDELEDTEKEIFLDIACLFHLMFEQHMKEILNFCGFHLEYGLQVLVDKSLITMKKGVVVSLASVPSCTSSIKMVKLSIEFHKDYVCTQSYIYIYIYI